LKHLGTKNVTDLYLRPSACRHYLSTGVGMSVFASKQRWSYSLDSNLNQKGKVASWLWNHL
jgi:hypothetical protein